MIQDVDVGWLQFHGLPEVTFLFFEEFEFVVAEGPVVVGFEVLGV